MQFLLRTSNALRAKQDQSQNCGVEDATKLYDSVNKTKWQCRYRLGFLAGRVMIKNSQE